MVMRIRVVPLAFFVAVIAGEVAASAQDATLRYRWVKGDEVRYRLSQQSSTTMSGLPGVGEMTADQSIVQVVRVVVQDVAADGTATLRETFESIRLEANSPAGKTVFDSTLPDKPTEPAAATMAAMASAMIGESVTVVMAPTGGTTKVEGMTAILEKAMKALPPGPATAMVAQQMRAGLGDEAIRGIIEQGFGMFPERTLKAGDTWTTQSDMTNPLVGRMTAVRTYRLDALDGQSGVSVARIAVTLGMKQTGPAASTLPGLSAKLEESTSTGEILFDATKGHLLRTSFSGETPMNLSFTPPGGDAVTAKGLVRNKLTMEIVEK
jgi:hypothetical protein